MIVPTPTVDQLELMARYGDVSSTLRECFGDAAEVHPGLYRILRLGYLTEAETYLKSASGEAAKNDPRLRDEYLAKAAEFAAKAGKTIEEIAPG